MGWAIGTTITGLPLLKDVNDYVVNWEQWEEKRNTVLGSPMPLLHQPGPAAWGVLDDESLNGASIDFTVYPAGSWATGGRRFSEEVLRKKKAFQTLLDYKIGFIERGAMWNEKVAQSSIEHLPVIMRQQAIQKAYYAATIQEGINTTSQRPAWIPSGIYGDQKCRLLSEIQRHFLEPVVDGGVTWQLWSQEEVHKALEFRTHRFLLETGIIRKEVWKDAPTGTDSIDIPQDAIEVRRVDFEYLDRRKKPRALFRIDTQQADSGQVGWDDTTAEPHSYIEDPRIDSMTLRTCPAPDATGSVSIRYVPMPSFNIEELCEPLPIPRMFTWAIKWGVIADLLKKEGEAHDPVRAAQAENMYSLGVELAKQLLGANA